MAPKITAPDAFTGVRSGIEFTDGVAEVDSLDDAAREVLAAHGFTVDGANKAPQAEIPGDKPLEQWTKAQLKAYAAARGIDLGEAKKNEEIVAVIKAADAQ